MKQSRFKIMTCAILVIGAFLGACNNNRGRGANDGANIGVLPTTTCLLSPNGVQGQCNYNYSGYNGFSNYNHNLYINGLNNNYANGFCGCGQGAFPVYNNNWGLGCINSSYLQSGYGVNNQFLMFNWSPSNLQWISLQQGYYNNYNYYGSYNTCQQSIILACDTGVQGSCGPSAACVSLNPMGGSGYSQSGPGLCVRNNYY